MNEKLMNLDLDVYNVSKNFPETEEDTLMYIRQYPSDEDENEVHTTVTIRGKAISLSDALSSAMDKTDHDFRIIILNAVLAFLSEHPSYIKEFEGHLKSVKNEIGR